MGRVQESSSEYTPEAEDAGGYGQQGEHAATYEAEPSYTHEPPQPAYEAPPPNQPPTQQYPPSQPPSYPPPPPPAGQYPPAKPAPAQYPPQPTAYPPPPQQPAYNPAVQFPPPDPSAAAGQAQYRAQYQAQYNQAPPPMSPYQQTAGAPANGYPVQNPNPAVKPFTVGTNAWTTGLFDCMDDPTNALTTTFFPCLTFGQIAEIIDSGHTTCATSGMIYGTIAFCIAMPCLMSCTYRTKLRSKYDLVEAPAQDWITHFFCEWCALCQEYRELKNRGWDPDIGWHANVARQNQNVAMTPPIQQTMMQ